MYRLELEEELFCILFVMGKLLFNIEDFKVVFFVEEVELFRIVKFFGGVGVWVGVFGW